MPGSVSCALVYLNALTTLWAGGLANSRNLLLTVLKSGEFKPQAPAGPVFRILDNTFHCIFTW